MLPETLPPEKEAQCQDLEEARQLLATEFHTSYLTTTLDRMRICPEGFVEAEGKRLPYTQGFLEAVAEHIRMPLPYAYMIDFDLFRHNFDQRKVVEGRGVTLCLHRQAVVSIAKAEYRPARTLDVLDNFGLNEGTCKFEGILVSDRGVEINLVDPKVTVDPQPGDTIKIGTRISNSETGYHGLKASLFALRLICSNGAVFADELGTARWNYDCRMTYTASLQAFQRKLSGLQARQSKVAHLYQGLAEQRILDQEFARLWRRLRMHLTVGAVDQLLGVGMEERQELQQRVVERAAIERPEMTPWGVYELHNRITAGAQQQAFRLRRRLEQIGGDLLTRVSMN